MSNRHDETRPVRIFGVVLVLIACISTLAFFGTDAFGRHEMSHASRNFLIFTNAFYALTGVGVVLLTRWGYILFKLLLYTMFLAFPIGTLISWWMLSYMRRHNLRVYFGFQTRAA